MKTQAAVAWKAGAPLTIETGDVKGPRALEGLFPAILGYDGTDIGCEVGLGLTTRKPSHHVTPLYTLDCRQCKFCLSCTTSLCPLTRATRGKGLMPDATSRYSVGGQPILPYMGTSTCSNHIVVPEITLAEMHEDEGFELMTRGESIRSVVIYD